MMQNYVKNVLRLYMSTNKKLIDFEFEITPDITIEMSGYFHKNCAGNMIDPPEYAEYEIEKAELVLRKKVMNRQGKYEYDYTIINCPDELLEHFNDEIQETFMENLNDHFEPEY